MTGHDCEPPGPYPCKFCLMDENMKLRRKLAGMRERPKDGERFWSCKIGPAPTDVPKGGDAPMRTAIEEAFKEMLGEYPEANFSGWGSHLTEPERAVVEDREPVYGPESSVSL